MTPSTRPWNHAFDLIAWVDDDILVADAAQSLASFADRFGLWPPAPFASAPPLIVGGSDSLQRVSRSTGAASSHPFNSGLLLVRASAKAAALLRLVWDAAPVLVPWSLNQPVFEQEAFTLLWPALRKTVAVAAKRALQSVKANFLPGDFALHAAGMATTERVAMVVGIAARCGAKRRAAAGKPPLCDVPGFRGGARFSNTASLLMALVGVQLGRSVAAVGAPTAGVHVLSVVASHLLPACLYLVPRGARRAAEGDDGEGDLARTPRLATKLDEFAVNASRRSARDEGAAFFATGFPRAPDLLVVSRVAGASSLAAAAAKAAESETSAARIVAAAVATAAGASSDPLGASADKAVSAASAGAAAAAPGEVAAAAPALGPGSGGGGLAAVLIFAPREADDGQMAASLRASAGLVRPASGIVCVLGTRSVGEGAPGSGTCTRASLSRAEMLAALREGPGAPPAGFRVAGASLPWAEGEELDANFFAAAREAGASFAEAWAANETARPAARVDWDCPAVCFAPAG